VAIGLAVLASCSSDDDDTLEKLQRDRMASAALTMAEPRDTVETEANPGVMDEPAQIVRTWVVPADQHDAAMAELEQQARAAGWTLAARDPVGWAGEKTVEGSFAQLVISSIGTTGEVWFDMYARPG
jgi:hypothetical protein